jgi:hypothetical protein
VLLIRVLLLTLGLLMLMTIRGEAVRGCLVWKRRRTQTILQTGTCGQRRPLIANVAPDQVGSTAEERVRRSGMAESSTLPCVRQWMVRAHSYVLGTPRCCCSIYLLLLLMLLLPLHWEGSVMTVLELENRWLRRSPGAREIVL